MPSGMSISTASPTTISAAAGPADPVSSLAWPTAPLKLSSLSSAENGKNSMTRR